MVDLNGRCMCGAVTWATRSSPTRNLVCHCTDCQRATSAPFTAFIGLLPDQVTWTGMINHYQSSPTAQRGFCPACGTRLYFKSKDWPGEIHVHAATLNDPTLYTPHKQVVLGSRAPWLDDLDAIDADKGFDKDPATPH